MRRYGETVLLATGSVLDALEVPASLGPAALATARDARLPGPVAVTAAGRWIFLVGPGTPLSPALERRLDVVRHGPGSWVAIAPSRLPEGLVRWVVTPEEAGWHLPAAGAVQRTLIEALGRGPVTRPIVPRQMSTARRAA